MKSKKKQSTKFVILYWLVVVVVLVQYVYEYGQRGKRRKSKQHICELLTNLILSTIHILLLFLFKSAV